MSFFRAQAKMPFSVKDFCSVGAKRSKVWDFHFSQSSLVNLLFLAFQAHHKMPFHHYLLVSESLKFSVLSGITVTITHSWNSIKETYQ